MRPFTAEHAVHQTVLRHAENAEKRISIRLCRRVTRQTIIATEQGKYCPSLSLAFRIARVFGVGIEEVFEYNSSE